MTRKSDRLDNFSIGSSCTSDWEAMTGNRQTRFCQECSKSVYNFSAMTRDEIEATVARFEGRLCARIERDASGTLITAQPSAPQLISRRVSPVAAALVTALISLSGNTLAVTSNATTPAATHSQADKDGRAPQPQGATATLSGVVKDPGGAVILGATVTLINEQTGEQVGSTVSNDEGAFSFASLAEGVYTLKVEAQGFTSTQIPGKEIRAGAAVQVDVGLEGATSEMPVTVGAMAPAPQPLRMLHQKSDLIVVAHIGRSTPVKAAQDNQQMKTTLEVNSVAKGKTKRSKITLYHWGWGDGKQLPGDTKTGDTALVFLKVREQGDGYELADTSSERSVKKLSVADLSIYLQRIEELNALSQSQQPDAAAIVEWLVRCAEQPATRWEGVEELASTADNSDDDQSDQPEEDGLAEEPADTPATVNQPVANTTASPTDAQATATDPTGSPSIDQARFGAMLNDDQKSRLKMVFFSIDRLTPDDLPLMTLVQHWKDKLFVPFLLEQLRRNEANPPRLAEPIIKAIADVMHNEDVAALAEAYSDEVSYADLDSEEDADGKAEAADNKDAGIIASDASDDKTSEAAAARQKRNEMLHQFIALVEKKSTKKQAK